MLIGLYVVIHINGEDLFERKMENSVKNTCQVYTCQVWV
jgi:hypothetical protein